MSERACENCDFWQGEVLAGEPEIGKCRRLPPRAVTELDTELHELTCQLADRFGVQHGLQPIKDWFGAFPLTLLDDWCGEFKPNSQSTEGAA